MKKKLYLSLFILVIISLYFFIYSFSLFNTDFHLFDEILDETKSTPVELGIRAIFKSEKQNKLLVDKVFKDLEFHNITTTKINNERVSGIEFKSTDINGYIEYSRIHDESFIIVNIIKTTNSNELMILKNKINNALTPYNGYITYYYFLKAKTSKSNQDELNEDIITLLKSKNATNIDSIKITNGYSTVAYTGQYTPIKNNNSLMDLNYSVSNYSSGTYIIIGSPLITTSY